MHVGYFEDPSDGNTLLVEAGAEALRELREMLVLLASGRLKRVVLHRLPFAEAHSGVEVRATRGPDDVGLRRDGEGSSFTWELSGQGWSEVVDQLAALAAAAGAGHQLLGPWRGDVVVLVSKGEYGEAWWQENG